MSTTPKVGVLALQGDFREHCAALQRLGASSSEVRTQAQLDDADALIIPGGESTSMAKLMDAYGLRAPLQAFARAGKPVWGTCAGLILMASRLEEDRPQPLGLMDIAVRRDGFGRQAESFEANLDVRGVPGGPARAVFIRAPLITAMGPDVETLASLDSGEPVAVRQGTLLASAFHPELTSDTRMHRLFLDMIPDGDTIPSGDTTPAGGAP